MWLSDSWLTRNPPETEAVKTIGLLGGMSWESTAAYYRLINEGIRSVLGGLHSARIVMHSVDFEPIERMQHGGDWEGTAAILAEAARSVEAAGADFLLICTNTMHKVAPEIEAAIGIPLLHIADATAETLSRDGIRSVGLLGTSFTMEQDFYRGRLSERHGLQVLVPETADRNIVHEVIYRELCQGEVKQASQARYLQIIDRLAERGAEAVILGCTEIGLLVEADDTPVRLYDTTVIHAQAAIVNALDDREGAP
jgi:aspartate racemase